MSRAGSLNLVLVFCALLLVIANAGKPGGLRLPKAGSKTLKGRLKGSVSTVLNPDLSLFEIGRKTSVPAPAPYRLSVKTNGNATTGKISAKIYEIDHDGSSYVLDNIGLNQDIIIGQHTHHAGPLILECTAPFPVQWLYLGDGMPEYSTNTSVKLAKKSQTPIAFVATASIGSQKPLEEKDTGKYICKSTQNTDILIYYYIFVPGKSMFTTKGSAIHYNGHDKIVRIPCSVTHPGVLVTLQKSVNGVLHCPLNDSVTFHPKSGFHLHVRGEDDEDHDPTGLYVCVATFNNSFQLVEYRVDTGRRFTSSYDANRLVNKVADSAASFVSGSDERLPGMELIEISDVAMDPNVPTSQVEFYAESPEDESTSSDERSRAGISACDANNPCGLNSICRQIRGYNIPHCSCMSGYTGKPPRCVKIARISQCDPNPCGPNSLCRDIPGRNYPQCSCLAGFIGRVPNCRPECHLHSDCPPHMLCTKNKCQDPCPGRCGQGAECHIKSHEVTCLCKPGYTGNPNEKCGKARLPSIEYFPVLGVDFADSFEHKMKHPCEPWPCGPLSECKPVREMAHCTCAPGYIGRPPNCRPECREDPDCPSNQACIDAKCRDPCLFARTCGNNAKCVTLSHKPECFCPTGFRGDPLIRCKEQESSTQSRPYVPTMSTHSTILFGHGHGHHGHKHGHGGKKPSTTTASSSSSEESSVEQISIITSTPTLTSSSSRPRPTTTISSPCEPSPCGMNAECKYKNGTLGCKCPAGWTGKGSDPYTECKKSTHPCDQCGPNSVCKFKSDGQANCSCKQGKMGKPPNCRSFYCVVNSDCPNEKACRRGYCVNPCERTDRAQCGQLAACRPINHLAVCACPNSPDNDPFLSCMTDNNNATATYLLTA